MKNQNKSALNSNVKIPMSPTNRIPMSPTNRIPMSPTNRMTSDSGKFFENFTKFKNTESNWKSIGFSKKV